MLYLWCSWQFDTIVLGKPFKLQKEGSIFNTNGHGIYRCIKYKHRKDRGKKGILNNTSNMHEHFYFNAKDQYDLVDLQWKNLWVYCV